MVEKEWPTLEPTLIENKEELKENLQKLVNVWFSTNFNANTASLKIKKFLTDRIHLGSCFVVYKVAGERHFIPSRFVGYKERISEFVQLLKEVQKGQYKDDEEVDDYLEALKDGDIDGRETNRCITEILNKKLITKDDASWEKWEEEYKKYCKKLQIEPSKKERKYWIFDEEIVPSKDF